MTMRTTKSTVTFLQPFRLGTFGEQLPAGRYPIETDEELLEGMSVVDPEQLEEALTMREQWTGDANRAAVEAEIKASPCFPLLKGIFSGGPSAGPPPAPPLITSTVGWWPQLRNHDVGEVEVASKLRITGVHPC